MSTQQLNPLSLRPCLTAAQQATQQQQALCARSARLLEAAGLQVIAHAFRFTARQEQEHAAILGALQGTDAPSAPPAGDEEETPEALLRAAIRREETCHATLFPAAIQEAEAAGHPRIAVTLRQIAENERGHARRFLRYLHALEEGSLLHSRVPVSWFCLKCGCLHHGCDAPEACEGCGRSRGHFIRSNFTPFALP